MKNVNLKVSYRIDEQTTYYFGNKNGFKESIFIQFSGIRESKDRNVKIQKYTKADLKSYYETYIYKDFKLDDTKKFVIDTIRELIFIPLSNKDGNIIDYGVTELKHYDKIKDHTFNRKVDKGKKYVCRGKDSKRLHEIIFGRKAKIGGWEKIENFVETDQTKSANWIKSIGAPLPHIGRKWDFCRDEQNNVYVKIPGHVIDHRNSDEMDNRLINLREIPFSTNAANKKKRNGMTSDYFGVFSHGNKWVGAVVFNGVRYRKNFDEEIDAAIFHDMYALALHQHVICNNGFLSEEQIEDILKRKEEAIPEKYIINKRAERDLPKNISKVGNKYQVKMEYDNKYYSKTLNTLEEAINELPNLIAYVQELKNKDAKEKLDSKRHNLKENFGYLESHDINGKVNGVAKINKILWEKFAKVSWHLNSNKRLRGLIDGREEEVHVHSFREYNEDYHRTVHGTIDHEIHDTILENGVYFSDCTIENLRCATYSQQTQNRNLKSMFPYCGITMASGTFAAVLCWRGENPKRGKRRNYIEDAARDYNEFALEKWKGAKINVVPNTQTTVADLYHKSKLTLEKIDNFYTILEIKTVFYVNEDWAAECNMAIYKIKKSSLEKYKEIFKKLFLQQELIINEDEDEEEIDDESENEVEEENDDEVEEENDDESENEVEEENDDESYKYIAPTPRVKEIEEVRTDTRIITIIPFGYSRGYDKSKININEDEAKIIRFIYDEMNKGYTRQQVADKLNKMG